MVAKKAKPFALYYFSWHNCCQARDYMQGFSPTHLHVKNHTHITFHLPQPVLFPFPGPQHSYCRGALSRPATPGRIPPQRQPRRASGHKQQWVTANAGSPEPQGRKTSQTSKKHHAIPFSQVHANSMLLCQGEQLHHLVEKLTPHWVSTLGFVMQRLREEAEKPKALPYPAAAESKTPWKDSSSSESKRLRNSHSQKVLSFISV